MFSIQIGSLLTCHDECALEFALKVDRDAGGAYLAGGGAVLEARHVFIPASSSTTVSLADLEKARERPLPPTPSTATVLQLAGGEKDGEKERHLYSSFLSSSLHEGVNNNNNKKAPPNWVPSLQQCDWDRAAMMRADLEEAMGIDGVSHATYDQIKFGPGLAEEMGMGLEGGAAAAAKRKARMAAQAKQRASGTKRQRNSVKMMDKREKEKQQKEGGAKNKKNNNSKPASKRRGGKGRRGDSSDSSYSDDDGSDENSLVDDGDNSEEEDGDYSSSLSSSSSNSGGFDESSIYHNEVLGGGGAASKAKAKAKAKAKTTSTISSSSTSKGITFLYDDDREISNYDKDIDSGEGSVVEYSDGMEGDDDD